MQAHQFQIGLRVTGKNVEGFRVGWVFAHAVIVGATHKPGRFSKQSIDLVVVEEVHRRTDGGTDRPEYHICKFEDLKVVSE
jgi:hypothetical protein